MMKSRIFPGKIAELLTGSMERINGFSESIVKMKVEVLALFLVSSAYTVKLCNPSLHPEVVML